MVDLFTELVDDLKNRGITYVGVDAGDENQHLHSRTLIVRIAHPGEDAAADLRAELKNIEEVIWQGEDWGFEYGLTSESVAQQGATHDVYIRGQGIALEPLFESWRDTWMTELADCPVSELENNKRWRFRAKEVREASGHKLSPRMSEVYALDELGRSTEEIASVLDISEASVESRRETIEERLGESGLD